MKEIWNLFLGKMNSFFSKLFQPIRNKIFGVGGERLDFLIDSFYKLTPEQRNMVIGFMGGAVGFFGVLLLALYVGKASALDAELNGSLQALKDMRSLRDEDLREDGMLKALMDDVLQKSRGGDLKSYFERQGQQMGVALRSLVERPGEMKPGNPLNKGIREVQVEMKLPQISLSKLLNFLIEIEKSGRYLRVQDLKINSYGDRLYFDANIMVRAYVGN